MTFRIISMTISIYISNVLLKMFENDTRIWEDWERTIFMVGMGIMYIIVLTLWENRNNENG